MTESSVDLDMGTATVKSDMSNDPSIFTQAWNLFSSVYQGNTEPIEVVSSPHDGTFANQIHTNIIDNQSDPAVAKFERPNKEESKHKILIGNSKRFVSQEAFNFKSRSIPSRQNTEFYPVRNVTGRRARTKPDERLSSGQSGVNSILDKQPLVGTHRSSQAEYTAQEYQTLLDGVKSFYPFITTTPGKPQKAKRSQSAKQMAKFIDNNNSNSSSNTYQRNAGQFLQGARLRSSSAKHYRLEETVLFHPGYQNEEWQQNHCPNIFEHGFRPFPLHNIGNPLQECYPSTETQIQRPQHFSYQQAFVEDNQNYLRNINEQLNRLNQERYAMATQQLLTGTNMPEVHNYSNVETDNNNNSYLAQEQSNRNQNNNVNINLTLAMQQQNGRLVSCTPPSVNYERQNQPNPSCLSTGISRPKKIKVDSGVQTELLTPIIEEGDDGAGTTHQEGKKPINSNNLEELTINPLSSSFVLPAESGVVVQNSDDLPDYSHLEVEATQAQNESEINDKITEKSERDWLDSVNFPKLALTYTGESIKTILELADEIVSCYVFPADEQKIFSEEEIFQGEQKLGVALMGLVGIPVQQRNQIYQTALENISAIHELGKGSAEVLSSVVAWLTSQEERDETRDELLNKARILASISSEIEPDSEVWEHFERDVEILTDAVTTAMSNTFEMVKSASRQCNETVLNLVKASSRPPRSEIDLTSSIPDGSQILSVASCGNISIASMSTTGNNLSSGPSRSEIDLSSIQDASQILSVASSGNISIASMSTTGNNLSSEPPRSEIDLTSSIPDASQILSVASCDNVSIASISTTGNNLSSGPPRSEIDLTSSLPDASQILSVASRGKVSIASISTTGNNPKTSGRILKPVKAVHRPFPVRPRKSKMEIIDIIPVERLIGQSSTPRIPSLSTTTIGSAASTVGINSHRVPPINGVSARSTPLTSSTGKNQKSSYKQIMMEKKQLISKTGGNGLKNATVKTNHDVVPKTIFLKKARTLQDKRTIEVTDKGSYLALHGSQSFHKGLSRK